MGQKWEFGQTKKIFKYQFFTKNKSVFMTYGQIPPRNGLNLRCVFLKFWESQASAGAWHPCCIVYSSVLKKTHLKFRPFLGGIWPNVINTLLFFVKTWYLKIFSIWPNSHFSPMALTSASIQKNDKFSQIFQAWILTLNISKNLRQCVSFLSILL